MLQSVHSRKESIPVLAAVGTTTVVPAVDEAWIYVHELIGDLAAAGTLEVRSGTTSLGKFELGDGQGITLQDEPGHDGVPRFRCKPGDTFNLVVTGGTFNGSCDYSIRY